MVTNKGLSLIHKSIQKCTHKTLSIAGAEVLVNNLLNG